MSLESSQRLKPELEWTQVFTGSVQNMQQLYQFKVGVAIQAAEFKDFLAFNTDKRVDGELKYKICVENNVWYKTITMISLKINLIKEQLCTVF